MNIQRREGPLVKQSLEIMHTASREGVSLDEITMIENPDYR